VSHVAVLKEALAKHGKPEIFNTARAANSPASAFTVDMIEAGVRISVDGRGRWTDRVFIERVWRSLKHEDVYLKGYFDGREAKAGIGRSAIPGRWRCGAGARRREPMDMWTTHPR
jgi:putative transposase